MSDQVQEIKDKLNIVDVVGQYAKLTKAGKNYKGLSPFTNEKTPSFFVSPDKGMYYDFSTSQGGDIFSFVQKMEGVDFKGALKILADKAGVQLQHEHQASRDARDRLYAITEEACRFFETKLSEEKPAQDYLQKRGLEMATMRSFRLGYAPAVWQALHEHLTRMKYTETEMERAGLIKKGESGRYYDRFRSRIIFPIMDSTGRVVAFSGRIFGEAAEDKNNAKYLNSPETQLFDKSRILYGYDKAKQHIRKYDFAILVEGQMDIVMCHQAGYGNTVAVSGTGLTEQHLTLIDRLTKKIVTAFDADPAGIASSGRAAILALKRGIDLKVAKVPLGKDPADCILEDVSAWKEAIKGAVHIVDFYLTTLIDRSREASWDNRKLLLEAQNLVYPYVALIQSATDQAHFVQRVANMLGIPEEAVYTDIRTLKSATSYGVPRGTQGQRPEVQKNTFSRKKDLEKTIAGILFWQDGLEKKDVTTDEVSKLEESMHLSYADLLSKYTEEKETLAMQAEIICEQPESPLGRLTELSKELSKMTMVEKLADLMRRLREAEARNDTQETELLIKEVTGLSKLKETLEHM